MKKTYLAMALSLVLSACGSGGSGAPSIPQPNVTPTQPAVTPEQPSTPAPSNQNGTTENTNANSTTSPATNSTAPVEQPAVVQPPKQELENTGVSIDKNNFVKGELNEVIEDQNGNEIAKLSGYNRAYSFNGALTKSKESSLSQIVVDNTVLKLADKVGAIGGFTGLGLSKAVTSLYNATQNPERDIFYFGSETAESNIPKSGIVTYQGNASRYDNVTALVKNIGTAELTANFDDKKIQGELKIDGLLRRNITLKETDIQGNGFKGEAVAGENHLLATRKGEYEGKFFGPNAEEVAGKATFAQEQKDLNTSFSAEQVK